MENGVASRLVQLCIEAACESKGCVEMWRRQRRTLERMPSPLADALLGGLHHRRLLFPSLLEGFKHTAEMIDLGGNNTVDAEWLAYLGAFRYLRRLNVADCHKITNSALWPLTGMACLKELDLSRCMKVTDAGIRHLLSISALEKLHLSQTGLTEDGISLLSSLKNLSLLDLGGLPVTDLALSSLQVLTRLQHLSLWGSKISDCGASMLTMFPHLNFLNLAWTNVTKVPNLPSLKSLNLSNCSIDVVLEADGKKASLSKLIISGSTFINEAEAFSYVELTFLSSLDLSHSSLQRYCFLPETKCLKHLDLSSSTMTDGLIYLVACIGESLISLNLSKTKISSTGVGILAGHVPNLEVILLSHTRIDDVAISYIGMMPSVKNIDLSHTNIKGLIDVERNEPYSSFLALETLKSLEKLNLEDTRVSDEALNYISRFQELSQLSVGNASLTDASLDILSCLPKLINLGVRDAVLTNYGLNSFKPPVMLKILDLRGCWLLTEDDLSKFHDTHPFIDIKHELTTLVALPNQSSYPSQKSSRTDVRQRDGKLSVPLFLVDQRLKYSREELLAFQHSPFSRDENKLVDL